MIFIVCVNSIHDVFKIKTPKIYHLIDFIAHCNRYLYLYLSTWTRSDTRSRGSSCQRNLRRLRSGSCLNLDTSSTTLGTRAVSEVRVTALALYAGGGKYFQLS